jgi:rhodanese-related sulfurtransferase
MKKFVPIVALIAAFAVPLTASAQNADAQKPAAAEYKSKAPKLNRAEVDAWLAKSDKVVFIDLRRPDELTSIGGLPVYLSIQSKDLEKYISYIPKDRAIITVSNHAGRAGKSADLLIDKGYKVVGIVGVQNYEEEGGTLVKIVPPAPKAEGNKTAAAK